MRKYTTKQAWGVLADTIEMAGMPPSNEGHTRTIGLCHSLSFMCKDGFITWKQRSKMISQLHAKYHTLENYWGMYWRFGDTKSRITACRTLAKTNR